MSSSSGPESVGVSVQPVLVELDDKLKAKLVNDLSSICEISKSEARAMLERDRWNIQVKSLILVFFESVLIVFRPR